MLREIERCQRHNRLLNLLLIDLDNFKQVNDLSGHLAGDEHLKNFSEILKRTLRNIDYICRLGGDEFAIILPDTNIRDAAMVAGRIWQTLPSGFSASGGLAELYDFQEPLSSLISRADAALYQAKRQGKNQVQVAD
jgi:diguanylate cyclase (GGDEF)-like protein